MKNKLSPGVGLILLAGVFWGITISTNLRVIWIILWYYMTRRSFACDTEAA